MSRIFRTFFFKTMSRELTRIANKMMRLLMITVITKIASSLDHSTALVRAGL